ncbi:SHOCT domain-containing protein [Mucilaginibacter aquaedulcis]|uniref:SHOCT domain-containing protein n=1 Tax=Mucilaginibacter aquaedulcis TaxID=1187081 RepID=UPI0025B421E6|nr:SHOCT domain-containing protein [Mucilaginibacter aquaedulcis]MDN3549763.1 SHOCT domain-containing protein [Mucilaginibacter aquaedulcis]
MLNSNKPGSTFTVNDQQVHPMSQVYDLLDAPHQIQLYKNLLDSGAITQQEYDQKKREFLDL